MRGFLTGVVLVVLMGAAAGEAVCIFDGKSGAGWITNNDSKPLKKANVQEDGLNPHKSGGYIVAHEKQHKDFVLDFDYKLSKKCNSGVFLRVSDLKNPVMTGLEIAIDDTTGTGYHDTGAIYDLAGTKVNAQKPVGEWNHMTITAKGPKVNINLNGQDVSSIDLDTFDKPGKRADGSDHKFKGVTIKDFNKAGYFGFQDHGQDCWYKNVKVQDLD